MTDPYGQSANSSRARWLICLTFATELTVAPLTATAASLAAQALLDQVFIDGPDGVFDSDANLTNGCAPANGPCVAIVLSGLGTPNLQWDGAFNDGAAPYPHSGQPDGTTGPTSFFAAGNDLSTTLNRKLHLFHLDAGPRAEHHPPARNRWPGVVPSSTDVGATASLRGSPQRRIEDGSSVSATV